MCIRQVATLLGFGEPQILEVLKNTLPTKLILGSLPNRRFSDLFMSIKDSYNNKRSLLTHKMD